MTGAYKLLYRTGPKAGLFSVGPNKQLYNSIVTRNCFQKPGWTGRPTIALLASASVTVHRGGGVIAPGYAGCTIRPVSSVPDQTIL